MAGSDGQQEVAGGNFGWLSMPVDRYLKDNSYL